VGPLGVGADLQRFHVKKVVDGARFHCAVIGPRGGVLSHDPHEFLDGAAAHRHDDIQVVYVHNVLDKQVDGRAAVFLGACVVGRPKAVVVLKHNLCGGVEMARAHILRIHITHCVCLVTAALVHGLGEKNLRLFVAARARNLGASLSSVPQHTCPQQTPDREWIGVNAVHDAGAGLCGRIAL